MNDIDKAIEYYKSKSYEKGGLREKFTDLAISALEKQIAVEVDCIDINNMAWLDGYCVCGEYVTDSMNYCIKCGQKLDWEAEDE